ncbi:MAG: rRNA maturation RNase YbeY [Anaerolineales bacterium]|nr:rRNA maturation RNase YbeY [Anaerolineales bacterium]
MAVTHIQINYPPAEDLDPDLLLSAAEAVYEAVGGVEETELAITIIGEFEIHELNLNYRNIDAPTDVLAFPDGEINPETGKSYLGDVVIAYPIAVVQAEEEGHRVADELQLLVIHGILHLLGYEHDNDQGGEGMWLVQRKALDRLGSPIKSENWI